jgi:hypothetical protein
LCHLPAVGKRIMMFENQELRKISNVVQSTRLFALIAINV